MTPFLLLIIISLHFISPASPLLVSSNAGLGLDQVSRLVDVNHPLPVAGGRLHDNRVDQQLAPPPATLLPAQVPGPVKVRQCEPIRIDLCAGLGYNVTGFPNLAGHDSASDAEQQLRTFGPLIKYECSSNGELRLFLCAVYVPMCTEQFPDVIGPCRSVCERVRSRCEPVLQHFGFPWPPALRCDRFHARNNVDNHMCMEGPEGSVADEVFDVDAPWPSLNPKPKLSSPKMIVTPNCSSGKTHGLGCNHVAGSSSGCIETNSTSSSYELIRAWTAVWSISATLSALFVVATFAVDSSRYTYLDRVVLLVATCSAVCALAHLSRISFGHTGSNALSSTVDRQQPCSPTGLPMTSTPSGSRGEPGGDCTVAFVVVYYFSSASSMWWLVLTTVLALFTLEKGFGGKVHWTDAEIRRRLSTWFHLVAWGAPALATIVLLVRKEIAVDMTSSAVNSRSVCRIIAGSSSSLGMELVPLSVCTFVGISFLIISFARHRYDRKSRDHVSKYARKDDHRDIKDNGFLRADVSERKLTTSTQLTSHATTSGCDCGSIVIRIGVVAVVGVVALIATVSCLVYDYVHPQSTSVATLLVKITSSVLVASFVGPWLIVSGQAVISWNSFVARRRQRKVSRDQQQPLYSSPYCKDCLSVETSSRCRHHYPSSHRPPSDSVVDNRKWLQLPSVSDVDQVATVHGRRGHVGGTTTKMAAMSKSSIHLCDSACRDVSLDTLRGYYQTSNGLVGLPPPPPPSQYTSSAAGYTKTWSSRSGFELAPCKCCYRQHGGVQKYVI